MIQSILIEYPCPILPEIMWLERSGIDFTHIPTLGVSQKCSRVRKGVLV